MTLEKLGGEARGNGGKSRPARCGRYPPGKSWLHLALAVDPPRRKLGLIYAEMGQDSGPMAATYNHKTKRSHHHHHFDVATNQASHWQAFFSGGYNGSRDPSLLTSRGSAAEMPSAQHFSSTKNHSGRKHPRNRPNQTAK